MIRLLCFDLDGTLIDSATDIATSINRTLAEFHRAPLSHELIVSHIGEGLRALLEDVFPVLPPGQSVDSLTDRFLTIYEEEMLTTTKIFEGVTEFLHQWTRDGGLIGVITNKNENPARRIIDHLGMDQHPWVDIFGADTLTERKPSPLPLKTMMKKAGVTEHQTLMIGDGIPDLVSAQKAGVSSIAIDFGYTRREILAKYQPREYLSHYRDLKTLIQKISS